MIAQKAEWIRRGRRLQYFTIVYNSLEALISLVAGFLAGSVSLVGFGLDSLIEVTSGGAVLWRLHDEAAERIALRIVGWCFLCLATYLAVDSSTMLYRHEEAQRSVAGILIAAASVVIMPVLARAKRKVAAGLGSSAMHADSRQTDFCTYLSAILLCGLALNAAFGWWWADPAAALAMSPVIAKEGIDALRGKQCGDCGCHS
jgi:divalent metal cation (Fe/Co/Zn/Cd) transporter